MENNAIKTRTRKIIFILIILTLLLTNIIMGYALMSMSKRELRKQIDQRMLDVANTAAYQLDGDYLKTMKAEDVGTDDYNRAMSVLRSFQENIQLDYIYALRANYDGSFTFTIDPDKDDPGEFGSDIEATDALRNAANGTPDVDKTAYTDKWGKFYSAYSPVFDSDGNVAGIVGVDFNADWYNSKVNSQKAVVIMLSMVTLTIAIVLALLIHTSSIEGEKKKISVKLEETLQRELEQEQELGSAIHLAYTDPLTGVKSKRAYLEAIEQINNGLADETVTEFGVIVFDLNGLKNINDTLGHDAGDRYIKEGCQLICDTFGHSPVYRIGGDEFAVILEGKDYRDREELIRAFNAVIEENLAEDAVVVSTGIDVYDIEIDTDFSTVFERADKKMYERKRYLKSIKQK